MEQNQNNLKDKVMTAKVIEGLIQIGLIFGLVIWCFLILRQFIMITIWELIITVAVCPL